MLCWFLQLQVDEGWRLLLVVGARSYWSRAMWGRLDPFGAPVDGELVQSAERYNWLLADVPRVAVVTLRLEVVLVPVTCHAWASPRRLGY